MVDVETIYLSNDPLMIEGVVTLPYTESVAWTFDERRVVWVQVEDSVGNISEPYPAYAGNWLWSMSFQPGWNHISLPLEPVASITAESLCDKIASQGGSVTEIDRWHNAGWDGHICGLPFNDFDVVLGQSYFIKSDGVSSWNSEGIQVREAISLTLQIGWNSISIPHTDAYSAESLCSDFSAQGLTIVEVDRWHTGGWDGHICGLPFNNFNIERGRGYFVKSESSGTVTPSELPTSLRQPEAEEVLSLSPDDMPTGNAMSVEELHVGNLQDSSATFSWTTEGATTGYVRFGQNPDSLEQVAVDKRGAATSSTTHHVVLKHLSPETTYYFEIISGTEVGEKGSITTLPAFTSVPPSETVYGQLFWDNGSTPAANMLVYLTLQDADGVGSQGEAAGLSVLTDKNGYWHANLGNARLAESGDLFAYSASGDRVKLTAYTGSQSTEQTLDTNQLRPAAPLSLGQPSQSYNLHLPLITNR
jgi:hypothetical protein